MSESSGNFLYRSFVPAVNLGQKEILLIFLPREMVVQCDNPDRSELEKNVGDGLT